MKRDPEALQLGSGRRRAALAQVLLALASWFTACGGRAHSPDDAGSADGDAAGRDADSGGDGDASPTSCWFDPRDCPPEARYCCGVQFAIECLAAPDDRYEEVPDYHCYENPPAGSTEPSQDCLLPHGDWHPERCPVERPYCCEIGIEGWEDLVCADHGLVGHNCRR